MHEGDGEKIPCSHHCFILHCSSYSMHMIWLPLLAATVNAVGLRSQGVLDGIDLGSKPTGKPYAYSPSNKNTRRPSTFADEVVVDDAYHDLVPALAVLSDLTTTTPVPGAQR